MYTKIICFTFHTLKQQMRIFVVFVFNPTLEIQYESEPQPFNANILRQRPANLWIRALIELKHGEGIFKVFSTLIKCVELF